ncbi:MAG: hypothetical protein PF484_09620 [Bacteroidales bacterium]|nr:hypothetical protein [Bacteroidales bacterium]
MPPREEFPPMNKTIHYASRIHNEGWIVFSIRTEETYIGNSFKFISRIIELQ